MMLKTRHIMALTTFEIAIGGISSIPTTAGLVFLAYKTWGEKQLDTSKLKPKKPASNSSKKTMAKSEQANKPAASKSQDKPSENQQKHATNPTKTAEQARDGANSKGTTQKPASSS